MLHIDEMCIRDRFNALNTGLTKVVTKYTITLDADTLLHKSAIRYLVSRIKSSPDDVEAVAGAVLVRNSRDNLLARIQVWDYFLSIASIKRMQGLFQGTLVAQGAFSLYKTEALKEVGGWSDAIGEDIVLTWDLLVKGYRVSVSYTHLDVYKRQHNKWRYNIPCPWPKHHYCRIT